MMLVIRKHDPKVYITPLLPYSDSLSGKDTGHSNPPAPTLSCGPFDRPGFVSLNVWACGSVPCSVAFICACPGGDDEMSLLKVTVTLGIGREPLYVHPSVEG